MLAPVARLQLREEVVVAGGRWLEDQAVEAAPAHRHHDLLLESLVILGRGREHHQIVAPRRPLDRTEDRVDAGDSADSGPEGAADAPSKLTRAFVGLIRHGGNRRIDPLDELRPHVRLLIDDTPHGSETHTASRATSTIAGRRPAKRPSPFLSREATRGNVTRIRSCGTRPSAVVALSACP